MIVKRVNLCALDTGSLTLGYVGENDHTQIRINCASVFADYPAAVVSMTVKAPSGVVYPREVETDGQVVIWTITDSDTASAGNGQIQLTFTEDGTIVKTVIAVTTVRASLVGDNPPPDPITDWIDEAGEALAKLEGMTASATQLPAGEDPTAEVEVVDGHYNIALGIPGGDTESIIDDTAGVGDVTKVWSANKSATELSELKSAIDTKAPAINQTASGDIVTFADGADGMPLSSCVVQIDPVQSGTGDPSPTNVRPITGHTGAKIWNDPVHGGNINWNQLRLDSTNAFTGDGVTSKIDATTHKVSIKNDSRTSNFNTGSSQVHLTSIAPIEGHKYYYASNSRESGVYISTANLSQLFGSSYPLGSIITAPAGATTFRLRLTSAYDFVTAHPVDDVYEFYLNIFDLTQMFGAGNEPTAAEFDELFPKLWYALNAGEITCVSAVNGDSYHVYPISWQTAAGTVYGGTLDTKTGVLTVTHGIITNLKDKTWTYYVPSGTRRTFNAQITGLKEFGTGVCSSYWRSTQTLIGNQGDNSFIFYKQSSTNIRVSIRDDRFTDAADFKNAVDGVQLVYELATPVTYQLDPVQIKTLMGYNALWADTGAVSLTYPADTRTYVDDAISAATDPADSAQIKAGTETRAAITPATQDVSAFFALAKLAGVDLASQTVTPGTYPDTAKVAIQKMLGIYESPWELIREDTFTNATRAHHTISVDGNGQPFELTSIRILIDIPTQDTESEMYGGLIVPIDSAGNETQIVVDTITLPANSTERVAIGGLEQNAGMYIKWGSTFSTSGNLGRIAVKNLYRTTGQEIPFYCGAEKVFTSIRLANVKGTMNYRLYGRRKWT